MKAPRAILILGTALAVLAAPAAASASNILVTQTSDTIADDGFCSLREAVQAANTNAAFDGCAAGSATTDTIKLPTGIYARSLAELSGDPDDNTGGDLDVKLSGGPVEIAGAARVPTEVRGANSGAAASRIVDVAGPGDIDFHDVSLANTTSPDGPGGGLRSTGADVTMERVRIFNDSAQSNNALPNGIMGGGGIAAFGGSLSIDDALLSGDQVSHYGAFNDNGFTGGGAILLTAGASADLDGVWLYQNTVFGNNPTQRTGGGGIAIPDATADVTIRNSNVSWNDLYAPSGTQVGGSGIYWSDNTGPNNTLKLDNDTIELNDTFLAGAAAGGILADDGTIQAANLTMWNNGLLNDPASGLQIRSIKGDGSFTIRSSAISAAGKDGECAGDPLSSAGYNVEQGPVDDCSFAGPGSTVEDPQLADSVDNGGPTRTSLPGNPSLIDRIPPASCLDSSGAAPQTTDQRGVLRNTGNCDVGAAEVGCDGKAATMIGTNGPDAINGTGGDDVIVGLGGDDVINGGGGNDSICGGNGTDTLNGDAGNDVLQPYLGGDAVDGGADNDTLSFADITNSPNLTINLSTGISSQTGSMANIENAIGGSGGTNQRLTGTNGPNVLDGSKAAEDGTIEGLGGDDTIIGGGAESLRSSAVYTNAPGSINANMITGQVTGAAGTDTIQGITGIVGSGFDDTIVGDAQNNQLSGGAGFDTVSYADVPVNAAHQGISGGLLGSITGPDTGTDSTDTIENLIGTPNDDSLVGNQNNNTIDGGPGNDTLNYKAFGSGGITVNLANHSGSGGNTGTDVVNNFENVIGGSGGDTITGDGGDNVLDGFTGDDTITGGGGTDSIGFTSATGPVVVDLAAQTATGQGNDTLVDIDNVVGSDFNDTITGNSAPNILDGRKGEDFVTYAPSPQAVSVNLATGVATGDGNDTLLSMEDVLGSDFADTLTGNGDPNEIDGGAGNDTIDGGLGKDHLDGGPGADQLSFASNADPVTVDLHLAAVAGQGNDIIAGFEGVTGSGGDDSLKGDSGDNNIDGGPGNDTVSYADAGSGVDIDLSAGAATGQGSDVLTNLENAHGSAHDDTLTGTPGDNILDGGAGSDTADYSAGAAVAANLVADTATGAGNDQIPGIENIVGSAGGDSLIGDSNANAFDGGAGNDTITGGGGIDTVLAGTGADTLNLRDSIADEGDCGADADADSVTADARGIDKLTNCDSRDTLELLGEPPSKGAGGESPAPAPVPVPAPPKPVKCKKHKKLKHGKCVKVKKKHKKNKKKGHKK